MQSTKKNNQPGHTGMCESTERMNVMKKLSRKNTKNGIEVRVHPAFVPETDMLASVNDSFNAVKLIGDSVGEIMLYGRGAGALPTGSAIVSDIIYAGKHQDLMYATFENNEFADKNTKFVSDFSTKYFIRLNVLDEVGMLSKIANLLKA